MKRFVSAVLVLALAATAARAADLESARRRLRESRRRGASLATEQKIENVTVGAPARSAESSVEQFNIGVEYKGGVIHKREDHIGTAQMKCINTGPDTFEVTLSGQATTPDKKHEKVEFRTIRKFKIDGNVVTVTGSEDEFKGAAEKYRTKILNMIALAYLVKFRAPVYGAEEPAPASYVVDSHRYQFTFARLGSRGSWREIQATLVELSDNNRHVAKFFLEPSANAPSPFRKFRIQTKDKLGINFFTI